MRAQSSSKKIGRIGRGPTRLMSPRRTFQNLRDPSSWPSPSASGRSACTGLLCGLTSSRPRGAEPRVCIGLKRPELAYYAEDHVAAADPVTAVEDRPAARDEEQDREHEHERQRDEQKECCEDNIERAQECVPARSVSPLRQLPVAADESRSSSRRSLSLGTRPMPDGCCEDPRLSAMPTRLA